METLIRLPNFLHVELSHTHRPTDVQIKKFGGAAPDQRFLGHIFGVSKRSSWDALELLMPLPSLPPSYIALFELLFFLT